MADQSSSRFKVLRMDPEVPDKRKEEFNRMLKAMKDFYADMREELDILNARTDKLIGRVAILQQEVKKLSKRK